MAQRNETVTATGKTKPVAKMRANQKMLVQQGHFPDLGDGFYPEVEAMKQALDDGWISDAVSRASGLMQQTAVTPSAWLFFLPEVMRAVLAENNYGGLSDLLAAARSSLNEEGMPLEVWEALLDEASFSMRHFHLAHSALQQLADFPLNSNAFPGEAEKQYFVKFRTLLAMERHGGLLHGIQQYELDPHMFCNVPLVDVHSMEADKVALTSLPEAGVDDIAEGALVFPSRPRYSTLPPYLRYGSFYISGTAGRPRAQVGKTNKPLQKSPLGKEILRIGKFCRKSSQNGLRK
jgi:hypothetical protein